jgi:hypothetical protein
METSQKIVDDLSKTAFKKRETIPRKSSQRYYILITVNDGSGRRLMGIRKIKPEATHFKIGENEYPFDISKEVYTIKLKTYFLVDIQAGQLHLDLGDTYKFNPKLLKKLIRNLIIAQTITRWTNQQNRMNIILLIGGVLFGGVMGWLLSLYFNGVI